MNLANQSAESRGDTVVEALADSAQVRALVDGLDAVSLDVKGQTVNAVLGVPTGEKAGAILLVPEWWGLNDHIKSIAGVLAEQGFLTLGVDLYGGRIATNAAEATARVNALDPPFTRKMIHDWLEWLRAHPRCNGKKAVAGWCAGTGHAFDAALDVPVDAAVFHYGDVARTAEQLHALAGPVIGHFATRDQFVPDTMVQDFEAALEKSGKPGTVYRYEADHAFCNPTVAGYDANQAKIAWTRTLQFLAETLGTT